MTPINYRTDVPKTLREACEKHADKIREVMYDWSLFDRGGYEIVLEPGYINALDDTHSIRETNIRDCKFALTCIEECDCERCAE